MSQLLTVSDAVATHARLRPSKLGARDSRRSLSFADWDERANRLANGLLDLGLHKGDRVALLAYNCIEWMEIYVALARIGLVAVPINFRLTSAEIGYIAKDCEARAFIVQDQLIDRVENTRDELAIAPRNWIRFGYTQSNETWTSFAQTWTDYEKLIRAGSTVAPTVTVLPTDTCALMYTSGTTGKPKGVIRNHQGSTLIAFATALEMQFTSNDKALLVMPMCHANSLYFSQTFTHLGATCVIDDRKSFDPEALLLSLANQKITFTSLVPTHYILMLGLPEATKEKYDLSAVEKLMISSAPARKETKLAILDFFRNGKLYELYGSTEAGWVTLLRPDEQIKKLGSVGREWAGSGPIRILDPHGNEVLDGEVGELYSRTPYVFDGYWKNRQKTTEAFQGDWCSVGDMARRDEEGFIHLVDRKSNMIISGGENIYPSEVESVFAAHPQVKDVAVVGLPHDKWGEAVHAVVVLRDGCSAGLSETEMLDWCRTRIAGYKRPQTIRFVLEPELPRTATGKIQHRILRDRLVNETMQTV
jgi:fatty-acyl-CoA synthase